MNALKEINAMVKKAQWYNPVSWFGTKIPARPEGMGGRDWIRQVNEQYYPKMRPGEDYQKWLRRARPYIEITKSPQWQKAMDDWDREMIDRYATDRGLTQDQAKADQNKLLNGGQDAVKDVVLGRIREKRPNEYARETSAYDQAYGRAADQNGWRGAYPSGAVAASPSGAVAASPATSSAQGAIRPAATQANPAQPSVAQHGGNFDLRGGLANLLRSRGVTGKGATGQWTNGSVGSKIREQLANANNMSEQQQRALLDEWKNDLAQLDRQRQTAKGSSVQMTANRQAVVAPATQGSLGSGRIGPGVVSGGSAPVSTYRGPVEERRPDMMTGANGEKMYMTSSGKHVPISQIPAYADLANRMKMSPNERSAYYASHYGVAPRKPGGASSQVAKSDA